MANKRSRSTFEAELTKKESPYVFYGTPLPPLDSSTRDDGSYVPVWQQEVRDERGRKRLHGAFTGGFSAGYFNTVGSKEGWTPQAFVSSRTKRATATQKAEDFMDEEDIADAEEAKRLQTNAGYGGLGDGAEDASSGNALIDIMRTGAADSMGVKLLQKMGWRQGQGVGPKIRRKARDDDDDNDNENDHGQEHLFAPDNSAMIRFIKKSDFKGLGYEGELALNVRALKDPKPEIDDDDDDAAWSRTKFKKPKAKPKKINPSFGVGVLNDTGSDDDDPYEMGPKISYNRAIGGTENKNPKKKPVVVGGANPLLTSKPIFMPKKNAPAGKFSSSGSGFRKCHDGRLPLDGFVLAMQSLDISPSTKYPPPTIPDDWHGKKSRWDVKPAQEYQSTSEAAKVSLLDPKARGTALGETALPGKSIFDFITPAARDKLVAASGRSDLPQARGEDAPAAYRLSEEDRHRQLRLSVPELSKAVALEALQRGATGWMPYSDDPEKRSRYRAFLELKAGLRPGDMLPELARGMSKEDWLNELREFAQAAEVFRPMTGAMASRFTTSRSITGASTNPQDALITQASKQDKPEDPAEAAAKVGMYGHMTRSTLPFYPTRLLCKRFGVRPPKDVAVDPGSEMEEKKVPKEMVGKKAIERMMQDAALKRFASGGFEGVTQTKAMVGERSGTATPMEVENLQKENGEEEEVEAVVVDAERNEALEADRPGDAVFKAIFGSDDEDD